MTIHHISAGSAVEALADREDFDYAALGYDAKANSKVFQVESGKHAGRTFRLTLTEEDTDV